MLQRTLKLYGNAFGGLSKDIWLLSLVTLINRSGTMVVPFLTVYLTQERSFSLTQAGWIMSAFGLGSVIGTYIGGALTDRFGYYYIQFWTLFLSGMCFIGLGYITEFTPFCIAIFVLSIIADAFRPANFASVAAYSLAEDRTRSYSLLRLAVNLGFTLGPALGGALAGAMGYKWLFWADGLTCMGAAILFRLFLKNKPERETENTEKKQSPPVRSAYQDRLFLVFTALVLLTGLAFMQFFSTMPVFYKTVFGLTEGQIGLLLATNGLLIVMIEMPMVYSFERKYNKLSLIAVGAALLGSSYLVFAVFPQWTGVLWIAIVLITFGEMMTIPFANSFALDRSTPRNRGEYMALYTMTYSVSMILAPTLGLQLAEYFGFNTLWLVLALLCGISAIGLLILKKWMAESLEK